MERASNGIERNNAEEKLRLKGKGNIKKYTLERRKHKERKKEDRKKYQQERNETKQKKKAKNA